MLLTLDTLDPKGKPCSSTCAVDVIEDSATLLKWLISQQYTLLLAHVWVNKNRTSLPLGAFTGSSPERISTLLQHWKVILTSFLPNALPQNHSEAMVMLTRQLINQYVFKIAAHERMINYFNQCIQRLQAETRLSQSTIGFAHEYELIVASHQKQLNKTHRFLERMTMRLNQLSA